MPPAATELHFAGCVTLKISDHCREGEIVVQVVVVKDRLGQQLILKRNAVLSDRLAREFTADKRHWIRQMIARESWSSQTLDPAFHSEALDRELEAWTQHCRQARDSHRADRRAIRRRTLSLGVLRWRQRAATPLGLLKSYGLRYEDMDFEAAWEAVFEPWANWHKLLRSMLNRD